MIEFKNVTINYVKDFASLFDFNLKINENYLIIGDEIKTSAMARTLAKIDKHYTGKILIDGENIKKIKDKNFNLAYVSKGNYLFNKDINFNLAYPLKIRHQNKKIIDETIQNTLIQYDLKNKKIKDLSPCEKKIITLLRATIRKPKYIVCENLFESLDEKNLKLALQIIKDNQTATTFIILENKQVENLNFKTIEI